MHDFYYYYLRFSARVLTANMELVRALATTWNVDHVEALAKTSIYHKIFLHNQVIYGNNAGDSFYGPRMQNLNFTAGMIRRRSGKGIAETAEYYSTPTMQTLLFISTHSTSYSTRIRTRQHGIHTCIQQNLFSQPRSTQLWSC